jgi:hypothetical protein
LRTVKFCTPLFMGIVAASTGLAAPLYNIVPLGLTGTEYISKDGYKSSIAQQMNDAGHVLGDSLRYKGGGWSTWLYDGTNTFHIGLTDTEHTRSDGYQHSSPQQINAAGQAVGNSRRYGGELELGRSAWLYDGTSTIKLGLTGAEHTRSDGHQYNSAQQMNAAGQVMGVAGRYNGGTPGLGYSAWLYDGTTTIQLGLTSPVHTRNDGYQYSIGEQMNNAGQVQGYSERYNVEGQSPNRSVWLYDGSTTIQLGFTDAEHTSLYGRQHSYTEQITEAGQVLGYSYRYNSVGQDLGRSAWLYDGTTTIKLGLTDTDHTRSDGFQASYAPQMNKAGQVRGQSARPFQHDGGETSLGETAWLYDGVTYTRIGLTGAEHTGRNGVQYSITEHMNEAGQVVGFSARYDGKVNRGHSAWLYDGTTTINIGLTDTEHTDEWGNQYSTAEQLNEAGQARGFSERYNSTGGSLVQTPWLYDGTTTIQLGFTSAVHTRGDGYRHSIAQEMNEAGQVRGFSDRYDARGRVRGQDAWLYDPALQQTFSMHVEARSDGSAYSTIKYLGDDGFVLGTYSAYDESEDSQGRAFYFTINDGMRDLGTLVDGSLSDADWVNLAYDIRANGSGQILGQVYLSQTGGQMAFLMTPSVPEPSGLVFLAVALWPFFTQRRCKRSQYINYE